jgi:hypothetical protein
MKTVYRGCRVSDLCSEFWGFFNYGLANFRVTNVNANFNPAGYNTSGLATTEDPVVAFCYACMQIPHGNAMAVFAMTIDDAAARAGSIQHQAIAQNLHTNPDYTKAWRSAKAQQEIVLPSIARQSILGYYTVQSGGGNYSINAWTAVNGTEEMQRLASNIIAESIQIFRDASGGNITGDHIAAEISRLMG